MACARGWLKTCLQDHTTCRSLTTSLKRARLPTRLIQLGKPSSDKVRLYVPSIADADSRLPYVTLSHRWGTAKFLTLSADTVEEITQGVSIAVLPQTFQDAIRVAKALQVSSSGSTLCVSSKTLFKIGNRKHLSWLTSIEALSAI